MLNPLLAKAAGERALSAAVHRRRPPERRRFDRAVRENVSDMRGNVARAHPQITTSDLNAYEADLLSRWKRSTSSGTAPAKPTRPHERWHTDLMYFRIQETWYFLVTVLEARFTTKAFGQRRITPSTRRSCSRSQCVAV